MSITDENHGLFHLKMFYFLFFWTSNKSNWMGFYSMWKSRWQWCFQKASCIFFLMCSLHIVWNLLFWVCVFIQAKFLFLFMRESFWDLETIENMIFMLVFLKLPIEKSISTILVYSSIVDSRGKKYAYFRWLPSDVNILFVLYCSFIFVFIDFFYFQPKVLQSHYLGLFLLS